MYSREFLQTLHGELARTLPKCTVLLGGSYIYGEPTSHSDVDFFVICPLTGWYGLKKTVKQWKEKHPGVEMNIMVIPKWMIKHGWYYVYGRTTDGTLVTAPFNRQMIITSAIKLAYFSYLQYLLASSKEEQESLLGKICQKIAIIETARAYNQSETPPLSYSQTINNLPGISEYDVVRQVLSERQMNRPLITFPPNHAITELLDGAYQKNRNFFTFDPINYLVYNVKFLLHGNGLFLFKNPDTLIMKKMCSFFEQGGDLEGHYKNMCEIIFPVIML